MTLDQYTADAICRSMGLAGFIEPTWAPPTLRLVLKPSFHPEACITVAGNDAELSVVALAESLWGQGIPCELPTFRERTFLAAPDAQRMYSDFSTAFAADQAPDGRVVCLDGMPVNFCLLDSDGVRQFACSPHRPEVSALVSSVIHAAWHSCKGAGVRNALADCGNYVGLELPREPEATPPKMFRVAVIGTPDNRAAFFEELQERGRPGITNG